MKIDLASEKTRLEEDKAKLEKRLLVDRAKLDEVLKNLNAVDTLLFATQKTPKKEEPGAEPTLALALDGGPSLAQKIREATMDGNAFTMNDLMKKIGEGPTRRISVATYVSRAVSKGRIEVLKRGAGNVGGVYRARVS